MEDFEKKIKQKQIEQLNLEKKYLEEFDSKFNLEKESRDTRTKKLLSIIENNSSLEKNLNEPNIQETNNKIDTINKKIIEINDKRKIIEENFNIEKLKIKTRLDDNSERKKNIEEKKDLYLLDLDSQNKKIILLKKKINNQNTVYDNLNSNVLKKVEEIKKIKKEMNREIYDNVLERHNLLQENLNNLILKKQISRNKEEFSKTIKKKEEEHLNLIMERNNSRIEMENNYLENLNVENALDKICNKDNFFSNFDRETEKLIFISTNSIKSLKKKKENLEKMYNFRQNIKVREIRNKKKLLIDKIELVNNTIDDYENKKLDLKKDINYLEKLFNNSFKETEKFKKYNNNFFEDEFNNCDKERYEIEKKLIKTNEEYSNLNLKLTTQTKEYNENINEIKKKFYEDKKCFENKKNYFKKENKRINSEIIKIEKEFQVKKNKYAKERKELEKRIVYLENKHISNNIKKIL